jgi:hypothetical protein
MSVLVASPVIVSRHFQSDANSIGAQRLQT